MKARNLTLGILMTIAGVVSFTTMNAFAKAIPLVFPILQVVWARYFFHTILTFLFLARSGSFGFLKTKKPILQMIRALSLFLATLTMYTAIRNIPLADADAIANFGPVLVTVFSGIILKEAIGLRRMAAVLVGFLGVLLIIRPGFQDFNGYMLMALLTAFLYASYLVLTRLLRLYDDEQTTLFYSTAIGTVVLSVLTPFFWTPPTQKIWGFMVLLGFFGAVGHLLLIKALHRTPASILSPFLYFQLLASIVASIFVFGDIPTIWMLAGTTILVGSGLYLWWYENFSPARHSSP